MKDSMWRNISGPVMMEIMILGIFVGMLFWLSLVLHWQGIAPISLIFILLILEIDIQFLPHASTHKRLFVFIPAILSAGIASVFSQGPFAHGLTAFIFSTLSRGLLFIAICISLIEIIVVVRTSFSSPKIERVPPGQRLRGVLYLLSTFVILSILTLAIRTRTPAYPPLTLRVGSASVVRRLDNRFLSASIDVSSFLGGRWWSTSTNPSWRLFVGSKKTEPIDLTDPRLLERAKLLEPLYLRIGGTESDAMIFEGQPSGKSDVVLTKKRLTDLSAFARAIDAKILLTLNANVIDDPPTLRKIFEAIDDAKLPLAGVELGNEVNAHFFTRGTGVMPKKYAAALHQFSSLIPAGVNIAGPGTIFMSGAGEMPRFLTASGGKTAMPALDVLTWHYYPQQSQRCLSAIELASADTLLNPASMDASGTWARTITEWRDAHAPHAAVWLGETGPAQCGGQPGLSTSFISTLWWLDLLGQMAKEGQDVVIRQTLVGSDYGLLDEKSLEPRPDYWSSILWKKLMGPQVLEACVREGESCSTRLRSYAHCSPDARGGSVLLVNVDSRHAATIALPDDWKNAHIYSLTSSKPQTSEFRMNGIAIQDISDIKPMAESSSSVTLVPRSAIFIHTPGGCPH